MKAVLQICDDNDLGRDSVKYAPLSMIETLQEAAYQQMQAEVSQMAASSQLPEAQEQALDEYPMPDEQVSIPDMQEYGYFYDGTSFQNGLKNLVRSLFFVFRQNLQEGRQKNE